ncbi:MAG TPA: glutamate--cysteine ligase [Ornithinibacter sp.]|nr:glutamate--cysteine ligase [Ornithinibacter sp.]
MTLPTFGVEEEFLLLDSVSGLPMWIADAVLERAEDPGPPRPQSSLTREVLRCQVESATPVCRTADELEAHLRSARLHLAAAADGHGAVLSPVGAAPLGEPHASVTASDRYLAMHDAVPALLNEQLVNGMHVHVAVPSRAAGVDVLNRLRPRLHVLLALAANSPFWRGRDSGFASWRSVHAQRWPVEGPSPCFSGTEDYEGRVATLLDSGVIMDRAMLYWHARVSERYPTVEIRVSDVALDAATAVRCASLVRALVTQALGEGALTLPVPRPASDAVRAAAWQAAHLGLGDGLLDLTPAEGGRPRLRPAPELVLEVAEAACASLPPTERDTTLAGVQLVLDSGGGAHRQRAAFRGGGVPGLLQFLRSSVTG